MRTLWLTALCLAALVTTSLFAFSAWPTFGGDPGRTGYTAETPTVPMSTLWKFYYPDPQNDTTPAVENGRVYFAAQNWLFCLDLDSGARRWEFDAKVPIRTSPLISGDDVIFGDNYSLLHALDKTTGKSRWEVDLEGAILSAPLIYEGKLYVGVTSKKVVALNPATGKALWTYTTDRPVSLPLAAAGGLIFALEKGGTIYALNAATGKLTWKAKSETAFSVPPVASKDVLYLISGNILYGMSLRGAKMWNARSDRPLDHAPVVVGETLYMTGSDARLYAMKARSGAIKWIVDEPGILFTTSPLVAGKVIFIGGSEGTIAALAADTGKLLWRCQTRSLNSPLNSPGSQSAATQPVYSDGKLLVLYNDGNLTCFSPKAVDMSGPVIDQVGPSGRVVSGELPIAVRAHIFDEGSGLDPASIAVYFDGEKGNMVQDPISGAYFYILTGKKPKETVADGVHTVSVTAKDYRGNATTVAWRFGTDKEIPVETRLIPEALAGLLRLQSGGRSPYSTGTSGAYGATSSQGQGFRGGGSTGGGRGTGSSRGGGRRGR